MRFFSKQFWLKFLLLLGSAFVVSSCQFDPYANNYTTVKPDTKDVIGEYVLTRQSVNYDGLEGMHGKKSSIKLLANGTYVATNIMAIRSMAQPAEPFPDFLKDDTGTWRVESIGMVGNGYDKNEEMWGIKLESKTLKSTPSDRQPPWDNPIFIHFISINLTKNAPPYGLTHTFGDADAGQAMVYERVQR